MKIKKVEGKLALKKNTVVNLGTDEMKDAKGGITGWCSDEYSRCIGPSFCGSIGGC
ncbi:MAG: hypothetical protein GY940_39315 [bacterium]|nr:hypothetical protein [bacterium]